MNYTDSINQTCDDLASSSDKHLSLHFVEGGLQELVNAHPDDEALRTLADACAYHLLVDDREAPLAHGPYMPMFVSGREDGVSSYPAPLDTVGEAVLQIWNECASDDTLHPLVRSRLADLLWVRRYDGQRRWFRVAVDAYVALAATEAEILDREQGLIRAIAICKESNHRDLLIGPLEALSGLIRHSLDTADSEFGIVARALAALIAEAHPCSELLDDALEKYGGDPFCRADLCEIALQASPSDDERMRLILERIRAFESEADRCTGFRRMSFLEDAHAIAREANLPDEQRRLSVLIEHTDVEEDMHTFEQEITVTRDELESFAEPIVGDDDLLSALLRFGSSISISDPEHARAHVDELARESAIQSLATAINIGPENSVTRLPGGHEMRSVIDVGRYDRMCIDFFANIFGRFTLNELHERYEPTPEALIDCFTTVAAARPLAERVALSYQHWTSRDCTSAVSVLVLTIEPLVRNICRLVGINVTQTRNASAPIGSVRTLGPLIRDLEPLLGPVRTRYLEAALVDRWSMNLRNDIDHGLVQELTEPQYVTLFHIVCLLRLVATIFPDESAENAER